MTTDGEPTLETESLLLTQETLSQALARMEVEDEREPTALNATINRNNREAYQDYLNSVIKSGRAVELSSLPRLAARALSPTEVGYVVGFLPRPQAGVDAQEMYAAFRGELTGYMSKLRTVVSRASLNELAKVVRTTNIPLNPRVMIRSSIEAPVKRQLTKSEIDVILAALPHPKTPDPFARAVMYQQQRANLETRLGKLLMVVNEANLEGMRVATSQKYEMSVVEKGNMVGDHMDNTIAASTTQTMFNTFSMVGKVSTVGSGAQAIENMLYTKAERSDLAMSIHFRERFTFDDVVELRSVLVSISVGDFIAKVQGKPKIELGAYLIPHRPDPSRFEGAGRFEAHEGYHPYEKENKRETGYPSHILRAKLPVRRKLEQKLLVKLDTDEMGKAISKAMRKISKTEFKFDLVASGDTLDFVPRYVIDTLTPQVPAYLRSFDIASKIMANAGLEPKKGIFIRRDRDDPIRLSAARRLGVTIRAPWWHDLYNRMLDQADLGYAHHVLRLHLDVQKMYNNRVTAADIVNGLSRQQDLGVCRDNPALVKLADNWYHVVASPTELGIIDIIPSLTHEEMEGRYSSYEDASLIFLNRFVRPHLAKFYIRGIEGIKSLNPLTVDFISLLKSSKPLNAKRTRWWVQLETVMIQNNCLRDSDLTTFFHECGFSKIKYESNPTQLLIVETLSAMGINMEPLKANLRSWAVTFTVPQPVEGELNDYIFALLDADKKRAETNGEALQIADSYVYAICSGSNLKDVISLPWVNDMRTITNDIHQMCDMFGVEATRAYYLYEFSQVMIESGTKNMDFHNLLLLGDYIFGFGRPLGVKQNSLQQRGEGYLTTGFSEQFKNTISAAAGTGASQSTRSMTGAVFTGQWFRAGRFTYDVDHSPESIEFISRIIAEEKRLREYRRNPELFAPLTGPPLPQIPTDQGGLADEFEFGPVLLRQVTRRVMTQDEADDLLEDDSDIYPWPVVFPDPVSQLEVSALPEWVTEAFDEFDEIVRTRFEQRQETVSLDTYLVKAPLSYKKGGKAILYNYMVPIPTGLYNVPWETLLQSRGFNKTDPIYDRTDYIEFENTQGNTKRFADIKAVLGNRLMGKRVAVNKGVLYINMMRNFPEFTREHMALTFNYKDFDARFFDRPGNVAIARCTGTSAFEGVGVAVVTSMQELIDFHQKLVNLHEGESNFAARMGRMIVSRYITNPLLYQRYKFHVRMYIIHAALRQPDGSFEKRTGLCSSGRIITAEREYINADYGNAEIHDTHSRGRDEVILYPRDLVNEVGQGSVDRIHQQMEDIATRVGDLLASSTRPPLNYRNGYEVLGADFMITDDFNVILLEVNPYPTMHFNVDDDAPWALERRLISNSIYDWIYNNVFTSVFDLEHYIDNEVDDIVADYHMGPALTSVNVGETRVEISPETIAAMTDYLTFLNLNMARLRYIVPQNREESSREWAFTAAR